MISIVGELWTTAKWIRHFIRSHPEYKYDSAVSKHVNYDLVRTVEKLTKGLEREEGLGVELLGHFGLHSDIFTHNLGKEVSLECPKMNGTID